MLLLRSTADVMLSILYASPAYSLFGNGVAPHAASVALQQPVHALRAAVPLTMTATLENQGSSTDMKHSDGDGGKKKKKKGKKGKQGARGDDDDEEEEEDDDDE